MREGTLRDIADDNGVTFQRVHQWRNDFPDFPKPLRKARTGRVYNLDRVNLWAAKHGLGKYREART